MLDLKNYIDLGYNIFLESQNSLLRGYKDIQFYSNVSINPNTGESGISEVLSGVSEINIEKLSFEEVKQLLGQITASIISAGDLSQPINVVGGYIQSANFVTGSTGWRMDADGNLEASSGTFRGTITAATGTIGGWSINATSIFTGTEDHSGYTTNAGDITIYSSGTVASIHAKNFYIDATGAIFATSATLSGAITTGVGSSIASDYLSGIIAQANLNISNRGWSQTCAFSVTDADTIAWGNGVLTSVDGTAYTITGANTGDMTAKTYIYLDTAVSSTVYQITTTATTAVGVGKVLVAIAQNGTTEATYKVMSGQGGENIDAANIVAGSITANEIAASTITAGKLSVSTLSSIVADLGAITAGTITLNTAGWIKGGQTAYNEGEGFFLGYSTDKYKLSIGNGSTIALTYNGIDLTLVGGVITGGTIQTASSGQRIVLTSNRLQAFNSSDTTILDILGTANETLKTYSDGTRKGIVLYENANATADALYMEMGGGSGKAINIYNTGSTTTNLIAIQHSSGIGFYIHGTTTCGNLVEKIIQADLDKTCSFFGDSVASNASNVGIVEIASASTSGALSTCLYLYANNTVDYSHIRFAGSPTPASPSAGDFWFDGSNLNINIAGTTYTLNKTAV